MFKIRLVAQYYDGERPTVYDHFLISEDVPPQEADALLCNWGPNEELLTFTGAKAWYCCEATTHPFFNDPFWRRIMDALAEGQFLYHAHPNPTYRVPHVTHIEPVTMLQNQQRQPRAVAVVSKNGTQRKYPLTDALARRNAYVLHPHVDLYGRRSMWAQYMIERRSTQMYDRFYYYSQFLGPLRGRFLKLLNKVRVQMAPTPPNYKGQIPGNWMDTLKWLSNYKVNVCMENTVEAYYFTEKFVNAVMAGCIPVYEAHPVVKETFLQGAMWVDPADFDYDVDETLAFALAQDREHYAEANFAWLQTEQVQRTGQHAVYRHICKLLEGMAG